MFEFFMVLFTTFASLLLFAFVFVAFCCSDTSESIHGYFAKRDRAKHPYRRLYKQMIKGKKDVDSIVHWYLCDIHNYTSYESVIADSRFNILVQEDKNDIFKAFRYILNLAQTEVLSDEQIKETLYFVFSRLMLDEAQVEGLKPRWYEKENLRYKDLVLLEAREKTECSKPGKAIEREYTLVFKLANTEKEFTVSFNEIGKLVNEIVKTAEEANNSLMEDSTKYKKRGA